MQLSVAHDFLPKTPMLRTARVMDDFGIGFEQGRHTIADSLELTVDSGDIVAFTGPSGSGKSSLLAAAVKQLETTSKVLNIDDLKLGDRPLVDTLPGDIDNAMRLLSQCGLGEAHLMLRTPSELSEGQRYRFKLALAVSRQPDWIVADEFTATLDRTLAKVISHSLGKLIRTNTATGLLIATTHDDFLDDLAPTTTVCCSLDREITVTNNTPNVKKTLLHRRRRLDQ